VSLSSSGGGRASLTEINVTPLVDVMLVLLIIFMVTAPLIQQGVQVHLPETRARAIESAEEKLVLSIRADRTLWLGAGDGAAPVPPDRLEAVLKANARAQKEKELFLMADKALPYGVVVDVMAAVQRAGVTSVGLITNPSPPPDRPRGKEATPR
jgi:biopolymer transport protein TolR